MKKYEELEEELDEELEEEIEEDEEDTSNQSWFQRIILAHIKKCFKIATHRARSKIHRND